MDIRMQKSDVGNPLEALRRAGYFPFRDPKSGEESFVCRLGADFYPRFHLYLKEQNNMLVFSLHLDQKQASYGGSHMHNGEYEGEAIEKEIERIRGWVNHVHESQNSSLQQTSEQIVDTHPPLHDIGRNDGYEKKKSWWQFWK